MIIVSRQIAAIPVPQFSFGHDAVDEVIEGVEVEVKVEMRVVEVVYGVVEEGVDAVDELCDCGLRG